MWWGWELRENLFLRTPLIQESSVQGWKEKTCHFEMSRLVTSKAMISIFREEQLLRQV